MPPKHRKILRDNIQGLTKPAMRRLCHKAGVGRISGLVYEELRGITKVRTEEIVRDAITLTKYQQKKVIGDDEMLAAISKFENLAYSENFKNKITNCPNN